MAELGILPEAKAMRPGRPARNHLPLLRGSAAATG
jgi:hypothetical protein